LPDHRGELVLGFGEASGGDGRSLCLEDVLLRPRQRVDPRSALEIRRVESLLPPDTDDVVELPDESGARSAAERGRVVLGEDRELRVVGARSRAGKTTDSSTAWMRAA
jgi:hypothetical protein